MTAPSMPIPLPDPLSATIAGVLDATVNGGKKVVSGVQAGASVPAAGLDAILATRRWMGDRHNWTRVGWFLGGGALVLMGAGFLIRKPVAGVAKLAGVSSSKVIKAVAK